nr:hypothetical protein [uncultured Prevotella sp.]
MAKNNGIYIGIDPDVDKNGVALLDLTTRKLTINQLPFAQTIAYLQQAHNYAKLHGMGFKVVVEAGWYNTGNWHLRLYEGRASAAQIGVKQGRNEQTSRLIGEMCGYYSIPYEFQRPLPKFWVGHDKKITKEELEIVTGQKIARCNQEGRDAALLAWNKAGFPIHISSFDQRKILLNQRNSPKSVKF